MILEKFNAIFTTDIVHELLLKRVTLRWKSPFKDNAKERVFPFF